MLMVFVRIFPEVHLLLAVQSSRTWKTCHAVKVLYGLNFQVCKLQGFGIDSNIEKYSSAVNRGVLWQVR